MSAVVTTRRQADFSIIDMVYEARDPALDQAAATALLDTVMRANVDPACRAVIIVTRSEASGGECPAPMAPPLQAGGHGFIAASLPRNIVHAPKPYIAVVEGQATGPGLALAAACDWVVAADAAVFGCDSVAAGLTPDLGLLWTLPRKVGMAQARRMILLGTSIDAATALSNGLVSEICPPEETFARALDAARRYAGFPAVGLALTKAAMHNGAPQPALR